MQPRRPPANDDSEARVEHRRAVRTDLMSKAVVPMDSAALIAWREEAASHLATWALQDGISVADIRSGGAQCEELAELWSLIEAVARAYHPRMQQAIDAEVETFVRTSNYPGGQEAALKNAQERFCTSLREDGLAGAPLDLAASVMSGLCLAKVITRERAVTEALRAEAIAQGAILPHDKPES